MKMRTKKVMKRMMILMGVSLLTAQLIIVFSFGRKIYQISAKVIFPGSLRSVQKVPWWNYSLPPDRSFISLKAAANLLNITAQFTFRVTSEDDPHAIKSLVFLKTHKTASSTLQNIFFRYAAFRNLSVAIPRYHVSYFYPLVKFHQSLLMPMNTSNNFLLHHTILNMEEINKTFGSSFRLTILRDPVELFISAYTFYGVSKCMGGATLAEVNLTAYSKYNSTQCQGLRMQIGNIQAHDLGFSLAYAAKNDCYLHSYLKELDNFFDLVLIAEMFDESLIVMKHMLKWTLDDVTYFRHQVQTIKKVEINEEQRREINAFNHADRIIYDHFKKKLTDSILKLTNSGVDMKSEILALRVLNEECYDECIDSVVRPFLLHRDQQQRMFSGYGLSASYKLKESAMADIKCRALAMPELTFDKYMKGRWASKYWKPLNGPDVIRLLYPILKQQSKRQMSCNNN